MPELTLPHLPLTALSEPVLLADGRLVFAHERIGRDAIEVREIRAVVGDHLASDWVDQVFPLISLLPGTPSPSDGGKVIALWPRMAAARDAWQVVYQAGSRTKVAGADTSADWTDAHGVWPIALTSGDSAWLVHTAKPPTSQGVFGYLDGRWWLYDEIWQSNYQRAIPGVLSGGWRDANNVLHLVSAYGEKPDNSDAQVLYWNDKDQKVLVAMKTDFDHKPLPRDQVRWPRGCSLADGRVLVHGSDQSGYYRAAIGPFTEAFRKDEDQMPVPKVTILPGWPTEIRLGDTIPVGVTATDATDTRAWIEQRDLLIEARATDPRGEVLRLTPSEVGLWNIRAQATGPSGVDRTASPRIVTVLPPEEKPKVEITEAEWIDLDGRLAAIGILTLAAAQAVVWVDGCAPQEPKATWLARYATQRSNGATHEGAWRAVRAEAWQYIEDELRKAKEELG